MDTTRYRKAISRNLAELQWALIHRTTLQGIEQAKPVYHTFLHSTYTGLFNQYMAHCMKIMEDSRRATSFWYIYRTNEKIVDEYAAAF